jgi:hypothetical protein
MLARMLGISMIVAAAVLTLGALAYAFVGPGRDITSYTPAPPVESSTPALEPLTPLDPRRVPAP